MNLLDVKRRFFITSDNIEIGFGKLEFKKVKDYEIVMTWMPLLQVAEHQVKQACYEYASNSGDYTKEQVEEIFQILKKTSMINIIQQNPVFLQQTIYKKENFIRMFDYFFDNFDHSNLDKILDNKEFDMIRDLVIEVHGQEPDREPVNATLAEYNRKQKELMMRSGQSASFEAMYTSVYAYTGDDPIDMTIYKFHKLFYRVNRIFNYQSNIFLRPYMDKDAGDIKPFYSDPTDERKIVSKEEIKRMSKINSKI